MPDDRQAQETARIYREQRQQQLDEAAIQGSLDRARMREQHEQRRAAQA